MKQLGRITSIALAVVALAGCYPGTRYWSAEELALIERLNEGVAAANAKVRIAFDPNTEALVAWYPEHLVLTTRLNVAFEDDKPINRESRSAKRFKSYRIVRFPGCAHAVNKSDHGWMRALDGQTDICLMVLYEAPPRGAVTTHYSPRTFKIDGYDVSRGQMTIRRPDGQRVALLHFAGQPTTTPAFVALIASALGLRPRNGDFADLPQPAEVERLIAASASRIASARTADLDRLVANTPDSERGRYDLNRVEPAAIADRAEALVTRFEAAAADEYSNVRGSLADLLVQLPQDRWSVYRRRIYAAMMTAPTDALSGHKRLVLRLADLGGDAGPLLVRASEAKYNKNYVALAACRIGAPVAPHLRDILLASWKRDNSPQMQSYNRRSMFSNRSSYFRRQAWERCTEEGRKNGPPANIALSVCWAYPELGSEASLTYLALRRMGSGAEADAMAKHEYSNHWAKTYASVGPQSPAKVCGDDDRI